MVHRLYHNCRHIRLAVFYYGRVSLQISKYVSATRSWLKFLHLFWEMFLDWTIMADRKELLGPIRLRVTTSDSGSFRARPFANTEIFFCTSSPCVGRSVQSTLCLYRGIGNLRADCIMRFTSRWWLCWSHHMFRCSGDNKKKPTLHTDGKRAGCKVKCTQCNRMLQFNTKV